MTREAHQSRRGSRASLASWRKPHQARPASRRRWGGGFTWSRLRKLSQAVFVLVFLGLFLGMRQEALSGSLFSRANLFLRLDPLAMLANALVQAVASRTWLAGSTLALLTLGLTLVVGRAWCGWVCPLGTLFDLFPSRGGKRAISPPEAWRKVKTLLLAAILGMALAGSLTLLILDPLTLLLRGMASAIWPGLDKLVTALETALYPMPGMGKLVSEFDSWARPALLPSQPAGSRAGWLYAAVLLGIVALNAWAPRFWCRYLCPLGGLLGLLSRVAIFRRSVNDECSACGLCERACPTGTIDPQRGYASDPGECTLCMDCLEACHRGGIRFSGRFATLAEAQPYDPGRRQALATFGLALAGAALAATGDSNRERHPFLLQPPGGMENELASRCVRCGACVRACPTGGLQPALAEAGLEGFWTPVLVPRLGYCDYSCNACGQVCPVQAIPPLSLDEKRQQVIGVAAIDRDRCIAWSGQGACIICEEMCPVPQKAVYLEEAEIAGRDGQRRRGLLPHVEADKCIGCGICEYRCPVVGTAAIRVYASMGQPNSL